MWHVWVWDSQVDPSITLEHFDEVWNRIASWWGIQKPWRFLVNGRTANPERPLSDFVQVDDSGFGEIVVHLMMGLRGGGPVKLVTNDQVAMSENFRDLAHMEESNFEGALSFALKVLVDPQHGAKRCDISNFLELEGSTHGGFFSLDGDFEVFKKFLKMMLETRIDEMLRMCGWLAVCQYLSFEPTRAKILFIRIPGVSPTTMNFLIAVVRSALVCVGMPSPTSGVDDVDTKIKLWHVVVFKGCLPRMYPVQELLDIWDQACTIVGDHFLMRLVAHSGLVNPDLALKHYSRCGPEDRTIAVLTFTGALRGGGFEKDPASVHELNVQQKNGLAKFLLSQGADLKESLHFIDSIVRNAGASAVSSVLGQKQIQRKWEGLSQLALALHVPMPQIAERLQKAKKKAQQKFQSVSRSLPANLPIESIVIQNDFFRNQDDTSCQQIQKISPNVSGVIVMRFAEARQWIESYATLSQDELAILIIGVCGQDGSDLCRKIQVPVCVHGEPFILKACLHQLGGKNVKLGSEDDEHVIPTNDTHVVCFTAVKDDMPKEDWDNVVAAPVKHMMRRLGDDLSDVTFIAPPWGRSFQKQAKQVAPDAATTIQFHARIRKSDLRVVLRASGNGGVFTCPKTENKKISGDYMVVWTKLTEVELAVKMSQCENHFGLVRSFKGDAATKGIRFSRRDFPAAFAKLRPNDSMPSMISSNFFFRVEPTPVGTTNDQVLEWINMHEWKAKPVRPISATTWLCVAEKKFEEVFPLWNGEPVLIRWVQDKREHQPVVLAGNVQKNLPNGLIDTPKTTNQEGDVLQSDPWSNWIKLNGTTGIAQPGAAGRNAIQPTAAQPPRRLEAPIEDKFQRQEEQIQLVRESAEKEILALREDMSKLEKNG